MEGLAIAGDQALVVEPVRDFTVGVIFEESVNLGDHGARRLAQHPGRLGKRKVQRVRRATAKAYLRPDVDLFEQGDIRDQQPGHPFALPVRGVRIVPQAWEISGQRQDADALLIVEPGLPLALFVVVLLGGGLRTQRLVPFRFQRIGDQTVVGITAHITAARQVGLVTRPLDGLTA